MRGLVLLLGLLLFLPTPVGAQLVSQAIPSVEQLSLTLSPRYPRPYETATLTVSSSGFNLISSSIVITADGVVVGENTRTAKIPLRGAGTRTVIRVEAKGAEGTFTKELSVYPADVALALEPTTSAHPFYEGGRLVAPQSQVRLVALPDIRTSSDARIPSSSLVYTWRLGNQVLQGQSGIGKNVLVATAPVRYRDARVSVTVATQDSARVAEAAVVVSAVEPTLRVYESDPLLGILFSRAIFGSFSLEGSEGTFRAVPYHFGAAPELAWTLNGTPSGTDPEITVRTAGSGGGVAQIGVTATEPNSFEQARAALSLTFNPARSTGIFGF